MTSRAEKDFNAKCREAYQYYVKFTVGYGMTPQPYKQFKKKLVNTMLRHTAHAMAATVPDEDAGMAYYITSRADRESEVESEVRTCFQCGHAGHVDVSMLEYANKAKAVICDICAPALTGKTKEHMIQELLDKLKEG